MITSFASILLVGVLGGLIPLVKRWTDRGHHAALAFSTGIFLGAVFLHLLPAVEGGGGHTAHAAEVGAELQADHDHAEHDHAEHDHSGHDHGDEGHEGHDHDSHDHSRVTTIRPTTTRGTPTARSGRGSGSSWASSASSSSRPS